MTWFALTGATLAWICVAASLVFLTLYALRHHWVALTRYHQAPPRDTHELAGYYTPKVTVLVPMHNEEAVAAGVLEALVQSDYDHAKLQIIPINDRSQDATARTVDQYAARFPHLIKPLHRQSYAGVELHDGKPGALQYAMEIATGDILLLFDADYVPARGLISMLAAPFVDPQIGAVMGRVVPYNSGRSLLAALLTLERSAGYQVAQMAHFNTGLTAQFGGTVGGVRRSALAAIGGWNTTSLTEDTDVTCRLLLHGWRVAYVNRAECYEEVPEKWPVRKKQLMRWVMGHTECFHNYAAGILRAPHLRRGEKLDALFTLGCYFTAPAVVLGWLGSVYLFFTQAAWLQPVLLLMLAFIGLQGFANQASFVEMGVAALLDGMRHRVLLLPYSLMNYFASTAAVCEALLKFYWRRATGQAGPRWNKTARYRLSGESAA